MYKRQVQNHAQHICAKTGENLLLVMQNGYMQKTGRWQNLGKVYHQKAPHPNLHHLQSLHTNNNTPIPVLTEWMRLNDSLDKQKFI